MSTLPTINLSEMWLQRHKAELQAEMTALPELPRAGRKVVHAPVRDHVSAYDSLPQLPQPALLPQMPQLPPLPPQRLEAAPPPPVTAVALRPAPVSLESIEARIVYSLKFYDATDFEEILEGASSPRLRKYLRACYAAAHKR